MNFPFGVGLLLVAAAINGNFALPMKYTKRWNWEIIWFVYTVLALIVMPWLLAWICVPNFLAIYASCRAGEILIPVMFGLGWGVAQVLYGLGISMLGLSLGNTVIVGIAATLGASIPLIVLHPDKVFAREGFSILAGVFIMLFGIYYCGVAGRDREMQNHKSGFGNTRRRYGMALLICILCGILSPMMTLALAFATGVMNRAVAEGVRATDATYLVWALMFPSGALSSIFYSLYLMRKNNSWHLFTLSGTRTYWLLALAMAMLWYGGAVLYGVSTVYLGILGVPIAQALFVIFVILGANATGFLTGEWRGVIGAPLRSLAIGVSLLALACSVIAIGNR
jgi:L-rhamnose-H+ transport protein